MVRFGMQPLSCWPPSGRWLCRRRRPSPSPFSLIVGRHHVPLELPHCAAFSEHEGDGLMTTWQVIEQLYDREINTGLQSDWDGGITVWIGGPDDTPGNERVSSRTFMRGEFADIALWLDEEARRLFPDSVYARNREGFSKPDLALCRGERPSI